MHFYECKNIRLGVSGDPEYSRNSTYKRLLQGAVTFVISIEESRNDFQNTRKPEMT